MKKDNLYNIINLNNQEIRIKAKDIKVFIENGKPYIYYVGCFSDGKNEYEIEIPKMDVDLTAIVEDFDYYDDSNINEIAPLGIRRNLYVGQDCTFYKLKCKKKEMTKEQIEKELGYKIDIVDEDDD